MDLEVSGSWCTVCSEVVQNACLFLWFYLSVRRSVSHSSIWILLILFPFSNPSFSLSRFALCPPPSLYLLACLIVAVCKVRSCIFHAVVIHLAASKDKHVVVDRRLVPGPEEQVGDDRLTWVGPTLFPMRTQGAAGGSSHLARWSGVKLSPLFIRCTRSLHFGSPWPPAPCHSGTREN